MPDNGKITLDPQARKDASDEISRLLSSVSFMKQLLDGGNLNRDEAECHLKLIRHGHDSLSGLLGADPLSKDLSDAYAMLRDANMKIADLESRLGKETTAASMAARMAVLEDWFCTWYKLSGFHYMSLTHGRYGIGFDSSDEIEHAPVSPESITFGDRELAVRIAGAVPYAFEKADLKRDTFHDNLLDTQRNHELLAALITGAFPGARITGFRSHSDGPGEYMLRVEGFVSWADIEAWHGKILALASERAVNAGKFYVRVAELAGRLASRTYTSHVEKARLMEDRQELARLRTVTLLWDRVCDAQKEDDDSDACGHDIVLSWDAGSGNINTKTFKRGTGYAAIGAWFASAFDIDVARDLTGEEPKDGNRTEGE